MLFNLIENVPDCSHSSIVSFDVYFRKVVPHSMLIFAGYASSQKRFLVALALSTCKRGSEVCAYFSYSYKAFYSYACLPTVESLANMFIRVGGNDKIEIHRKNVSVLDVKQELASYIPIENQRLLLGGALIDEKWTLSTDLESLDATQWPPSHFSNRMSMPLSLGSMHSIFAFSQKSVPCTQSMSDDMLACFETFAACLSDGMEWVPPAKVAQVLCKVGKIMKSTSSTRF